MRMLGGLVAVLMLCSCKSPLKPGADGTCPEGWYLNSDHDGEWGSNTQSGDGLCYQRCKSDAECVQNQKCNVILRCGGGAECVQDGAACNICSGAYCYR